MAKVLVIDDAKFSRFMLAKILKSLNFEIIEAEDGKQGLDIISNEKPDLILTDLLMPVMNGIELLTELKELGSNIPVVVVSSNIQESVQLECQELGAIDFLSKPPNSQKLIDIVKRVFNL